MLAWRVVRPVVAAGLLSLTLAACGSAGHVGGHLDQRGQSTPPDAVYMSAVISEDRVSLSPARIGAGNLIFNIVNNDSGTERLKLLAAHTDKPEVSIGPIPGGGSYQIKLTLAPGRYLLGSPNLNPATAIGGDTTDTSSADTGTTAGDATGTENPGGLIAAALTIGPARGGGDEALNQP